MKHSTEPKICTEQVEQCTLELAGESWISVRYDYLRARKWAHVTTDLITDLPESNGFTAIVVFIDKLTKMVHLVGCKKEVIAMEYAKSSLTMSFGYMVSRGNCI